MQRLKRSMRKMEVRLKPWAGRHKAEIAAVVIVVMVVGVCASLAAKHPSRKVVVQQGKRATVRTKNLNQSPRQPNTTKPRSARAGKDPASPANISELQQRHYEQAYARLKNRLGAGVASKTLTKQQADLLLKKLDEMKAYRLSLLGKPAVERSKLLSAKRKELRQWALENKIPPQYGLTLL